MAQVDSMEVDNPKGQKIEEAFEDRDIEIFDTLLLNGPISDVKENMRLLKEQRTDMHNIHQSFFHLFAIDQTPYYLEFVA